MSSGTGRDVDGGERAAATGADRRIPRLLGAFDARVESVRTDPRRRRAALFGAVLVGILLARIHWLGLVLAGALVGVTRTTTPRAVLSGVAVGLATVPGTVLLAPAIGGTEFLALDPVNYVSVGIAVVAPAWGGLVRWAI